MSDAFQDRENTFEKQFAHDEDLRFKAVARRNKAVALWVAEAKGSLGLTPRNTRATSSARRSARATTTSPRRLRQTSPAATSISRITVCARRWTRRWRRQSPRLERASRNKSRVHDPAGRASGAKAAVTAS